MDRDTFEAHARELSIRLDYAFAGLIFGAWALSVEFSPKMGTKWAWLLIISWALFAVASFFAGWRVVSQANLARISFHKAVIQEFVNRRKAELENPTIRVAALTGPPLATEVSHLWQIPDRRFCRGYHPQHGFRRAKLYCFSSIPRAPPGSDI